MPKQPHPAVGVPCQCQFYNYCNCLDKKNSTSFLKKNIADAAECLVEVLILCGIKRDKAKAAFNVIRTAFLHYDHVRVRIDAYQQKRMRKDRFMCGLGREAGVARTEAHMVYAIVKRAFKAFYYGTDIYGLPNAYFKYQQPHSPECLWSYAAKMTAYEYAYYSGMLRSKQEAYHSRIRDIYYHLNERIKERTSHISPKWVCDCLRCKKRFSNKDDSQNNTKDAKGDMRANLIRLLGTRESDLIKILKKRNERIRLGNKALNVPPPLGPPPRKPCDCPKLTCSCANDNGKKLLLSDCGAGPFHCRWHRTSHTCLYDQDITNIFIPPPKKEVCSTCDSCEGESILCICEGECDCVLSNESGIEEDDNEEEMLEELPEEESSNSTSAPLIPAMERYPDPSFGGCRVLKTPCHESYTNQERKTGSEARNRQVSIGQYQTYSRGTQLKDKPTSMAVPSRIGIEKREASAIGTASVKQNSPLHMPKHKEHRSTVNKTEQRDIRLTVSTPKRHTEQREELEDILGDFYL